MAPAATAAAGSATVRSAAASMVAARLGSAAGDAARVHAAAARKDLAELLAAGTGEEKSILARSLHSPRHRDKSMTLSQALHRHKSRHRRRGTCHRISLAASRVVRLSRWAAKAGLGAAVATTAAAAVRDRQSSCTGLRRPREPHPCRKPSRHTLS